jgi:transcriptional regulator with XRE-family HTH domain
VRGRSASAGSASAGSGVWPVARHLARGRMHPSLRRSRWRPRRAVHHVGLVGAVRDRSLEARHGHVTGGEAPDVRLPCMTTAPRTRQRPTETSREARRLTASVAVSLGRAVRAARTRLHLTQAAVGARLGVHQTTISRIELGRGGPFPLGLWIGLGVALGRPIAISFTRPLGETRAPTDAGHLAMQERLLELARATGRTGTVELPTRPADPSRSIDVCVRDPRHRVLLVQEAWNTFGDLGAAVRSTHRKAGEAGELAATLDDGPPYRVATVWVVRSNAANRALVGRYPEIFGAAFPGSSRAWAQSLTTGAAPPADPGLVWLDPASGRPAEWRRARPVVRRHGAV